MKRAFIVIVLLLVGCVGGLNAYVLLGNSWPDGSVLMQLQLGSSGTLIDGTTSWGQSAEGALATWNSYMSRLQFRVTRDSTAAAGGLNGYNNVFWSSTVYGQSFGSSTLATTLWWWQGSTRVETDVIFNNALSWNSYSGNLRSSSAGYDFRRVAIHEFGHALGLGHPDDYGQSVSAIMNSHISNLDSVTADDVAGVAALYGAASTPTATAPGVPSSLVVSSSGSSVSLTWRAPTTGGTPSSYVIEAGATPGAVNLANVSTGNTSTSFSASGVGAGVYYVRVKA